MKKSKTINKSTDALFLNASLAGDALFEQGRFSEALNIYLKDLEQNKRNRDLLYRVALTQQKLGNYQHAIDIYTDLIKKNKRDEISYFNRANLFLIINKLDVALKDYNLALTINKNFAEAYQGKGHVYIKSGMLDRAIESYETALSIKSSLISSIVNLCFLLNSRREFKKTCVLIEKAKRSDITNDDIDLNYGVALKGLNKTLNAQNIFSEILARNPNHLEAIVNKAITAASLKKFHEASEWFQRAIKISPNNEIIIYNYGKMFFDKKDYNKALELLDQSIKINPKYIDAIHEYANCCRMQKDHLGALKYFEKGYIINPEQPFLLSDLLNQNIELCEWKEYKLKQIELKEKIRINKIAMSPLGLIRNLDDPILQLQSLKRYSDYKCYKSNKFNFMNLTCRHKKYRIGYYSADFRDHPVSYLTAELFELHDRSKFEIYAFSFTPRIENETQNRIAAGVDHFIDVSGKSDDELVTLSRELGIDIAIDLMGYTADARTEIFAQGCAPIQVNYLGFPATMGADYIDYIIADKIVIPEENREYFTEKIVYMPDTFFVNDSKRRISDRVFSRAEFDLPEAGFVFCCFNNSYKILPDIFDRWVSILKAVEGSVIWLSYSNEHAVRNLRREAEARGLDPKRLIFAPRMDRMDEHLARLKLADLFLDTLPYNAHTTASDALWVGLPLLTCMGKSFASRVAASLLTAIDVPELITTSLDEYQAKAIALAKEPEKLEQIRKKLIQNRSTTPLFDTKRFTRNLETAFEQMVQQFTNDRN